MSNVMLDRSETVRQIEQLGIVAVIRLRDPGKLRAVVDAIMAGGVRALEVTMTVPGRGRSDSRRWRRRCRRDFCSAPAP